MKIVLDTNVLVAGLLTPLETCGEIVRSLNTGLFTLCVDARILFEYEDVLRRPRFGFDLAMIHAILENVDKSAVVYNPSPLGSTLTDPDDNPFLEVSIAAPADCLVTGNLKHFPPQNRQGVIVLSPAQFVEELRKLNRGI